MLGPVGRRCSATSDLLIASAARFTAAAGYGGAAISTTGTPPAEGPAGLRHGHVGAADPEGVAPRLAVSAVFSSLAGVAIGALALGGFLGLFDPRTGFMLGGAVSYDW